jgi:catechol 2,3-dioxygenase-like lactoylglutathione lyase family enzyme
VEPRITVITLGVRDLEKSLRFYRDGLGLPTVGIIGTEFEGGAVVFFDMNNGLKLALFPIVELAKDAKLHDERSGTPGFSIGHNVNSKQAVNDVMEQAAKAGATITDPPHDRVWGGYTGYFQDPDGNLWEIVWNPQLVV